jgi:hypothetical protein
MADQLKPASFTKKAENLLESDIHPVPLSERPTFNSMDEFVSYLKNDKTSDIDARVMAINLETGELGYRQLNKKEFLEAVKKAPKALSEMNLREADAFATDGDLSPSYGVVGDDFVPLVGGPFYKQLYQTDYIRQANASYWAWNHDPIAHQALNIIRDFTLGRGYRIDSDNEAALSVWRAYEKANDVQGLMHKIALEISLYGETMIWKLSDNNAKIVQAPYPGQKIPKAFIPRIRVIDPTVMWDIVTQPEDISSVLYYVWVAPTQYQVYSGLDSKNQVPGSKFIFQQIPADQILHYKVNVVSNEKRGRSDLFPALGFLKRLRDSVNYSIIALQKQASYCIDTTIRGSQADIDNYISEQQSIGTIAPAGSEFVHTDAIERKYMGVEGAKAGASPAFEWALSMVASALGIPISYFGTHLSGGQTRASALVATEPVAKRFEMRQQIYERILHDLWDHCMEWAGLGNVECEVTFPDIITADRSQKLKDLALAESQGWISKETAAQIAAKELNITTYDYNNEREKLKQDSPESPLMSPLTAPANALSSAQKTELKKQYV